MTFELLEPRVEPRPPGFSLRRENAFLVADRGHNARVGSGPLSRYGVLSLSGKQSRASYLTSL